MNPRHFILTALLAPLFTQSASAAPPQLEIYKTPTCGCCSFWVERMTEAGFSADARDVDHDTLWSLKERAGIPSELSSCHTTFIEDYFIEGHIPAADIRRLLSERLDALGLAVPGMPMGAPGMEMGPRRDAYSTFLVHADGSLEIFASHP